MQFRFREWDEESQRYNLITLCNIDDYDTMFKTLTYMKEHKCEYAIELNTESVVDTAGDCYEVEQVGLCISKEIGDDGLIPHFVVDVVSVN